MNKEPMRVQITYSRGKRGAFILNGMDITHKTSAVSVNIRAHHLAEVTFTVFVDELDADIEVEEAQP